MPRISSVLSKVFISVFLSWVYHFMQTTFLTHKILGMPVGLLVNGAHVCLVTYAEVISCVASGLCCCWSF